ncbi:hypothetical protein GCM10017691_46420 [Pseudonocardia petroleophila]|uniref:Uncharacterized protein n=1 Tax=Pseudonocardia petroleophila TaxID=37331 RepID=A0A7G7MQT7_9PSEU|nr:hypothetical protein [Pseudonocardia petroleophila]QNG55148.1 hypothetical protein H6H00_15565 [Pseudonocardia petroleophila]
MQVTFTRTGQRRYAVTAVRPVGDRVRMDPAPGYHAHVPHDLVHFVVERHFRLRDGIFGSLVAGGDAGTFRPVDEPYTKKWARRNARRTDGVDMRRSEAFTRAAQSAWEIRHADRPVPPGVRAWTDEAGAGVDPAALDAVVDVLDGIAPDWHALPVGGSLVLEWS